MRVQLRLAVVLCLIFYSASIPVPSSVAKKAADELADEIGFATAVEQPPEELLESEVPEQSISELFQADDQLNDQVEAQLAQAAADALADKNDPTTDQSKIRTLKKNGKKVAAALKAAKARLKAALQGKHTSKLEQTTKHAQGKKAKPVVAKKPAAAKKKPLHAKKMKPLCITQHPCP